MKVKKEIEIKVCDLCGSEVGYLKCINCGIDICRDCIKNGNAVEYRWSVYFTGGYDGHYCRNCDNELTADGNNTLHNSYMLMEKLITEHKKFGDSFKKREEACTKKIEAIRREIEAND